MGLGMMFEIKKESATEAGGALLDVTLHSAAGQVEGQAILDKRGELTNMTPELQKAVDDTPGAIQDFLDVARQRARAAKLIPPVPYPEREITKRPRILTIRDGKDEEANGEGCLVVVDDPAAVVATGKYGGPPEAPPNRDFIRDIAGLPGRKYLVVTDQAGKPIQPPRSLDGRVAVFHGKDVTGEVLAFSTEFATVFRSWDDAEMAIFEARVRGLLP